MVSRLALKECECQNWNATTCRFCQLGWESKDLLTGSQRQRQPSFYMLYVTITRHNICNMLIISKLEYCSQLTRLLYTTTIHIH